MDTVILGAGLTGLLTAWKLIRARPDLRIAILERAPQPGGLFQSSQSWGHWYNHGLFLFRHNSRLVTLFPESFNSGSVEFLKFNGTELKLFPIDPGEISGLISGLRKISAAVGCAGMLWRRWLRRSPGNLEDWLACYLPPAWTRELRLDQYIYKLMGSYPVDLSPALGEQRLDFIRNATSFDAVKLRLKLKFGRGPGKMSTRISGGDSTEPEFMRLYRLNGEGTGGLVRRIAGDLAARGVRVYHDAEITAIESSLEGFLIHINGTDPMATRQLISTIPMETLTALIPGAPSMDQTLEYRDMLVLLFRLKGGVAGRDNRIIYSFDGDTVWKRAIIESAGMNEAAMTVEITGPRGAEFEPGRLKHDVVTDFTDRLRMFDASQVLAWDHRRISRAYPSMLSEYEKSRTGYQAALNQRRIRSIGRQGGYAYYSTDQVVDAAFTAADEVLEMFQGGTGMPSNPQIS